MTESNPTTGIVLSYQSNFYTVKVEAATVQCFLKGNLKKEGVDVLVGDRVTVDNFDRTNQTGRIIQVLGRTNQLARPKIANITRAMVVAAIRHPDLELLQLDRYLTHIQLAGISPLICISKADLAPRPEALAQVREIYKPLGIPVYATSVQEAESVERLFTDLHGETVVLAGLSGVGKSSLLNAYQPGLRLAVGEVSEKIRRGQHTTRHVALIAIAEDTYIADTPGFSYLSFESVAPAAIEAAFPDFAPYRVQCRFDNCLHREEVGCAVRENLDQIAPSRYESYRVFQEEAKAYADTVLSTSQKQETGYKTLQRGKAQELQILKLSGKQRQASRRTQKQRVHDWEIDAVDDTLEEP